MNRPISRKGHGLAEWSYIPLTALSPEIMRFKDDPKATTFARVLGGLMLGSAVLTKSEWGLFKVLPFKAHLAGDIGISLASVLAPWLGKFSEDKKARNTFVFLGLSGLLIGGILTQWKEMSRA